MTNFIPLFPLNLVVYPGENLNLHIFEPRYIQLINDCFQKNKEFGIPVVLNAQLSEFGTLLEIIEIVKQYPDGKLDIKTKGKSIFRILEIVKNIPEKLYQGAIVNYPKNKILAHKFHIQKLLVLVRELHTILKLEKEFLKHDEELLSYDIAHHIGLSVEQEFELLCLFEEDQRLEYLKRYLSNAIPVASGFESLAQKIKLNGHFKELKGFNFDF